MFLWGQSNVSTPVYIFSGHSEAVLDLQWLSSERLATWSKDRTLRIWGISEQLRSSLGADSAELSASLDNSSSFPASTEFSIDMSLEEGVVDPTSIVPQGLKEVVDPSVSLPILKPPSEAHSPRGSRGSPSTQSLASLSQLDASPVFQPTGYQSLAQEFSQLRVENLPNLDIERVCVIATPSNTVSPLAKLLL